VVLWLIMCYRGIQQVLWGGYRIKERTLMSNAIFVIIGSWGVTPLYSMESPKNKR
jgi:hypothetical protein